ncbi:MAG TPA: dihydroxyacetone kinase subunit DhaL [Methylophilaceae bacterium]|nr:dihydroxyacetone kinase subunit DhaL [Methylophilaceae bacterium]
MKTEFILQAAEAVKQAIAANESELESLDRAIGDGDHFINMKRGSGTVVEMRDELAPLTPDAALNKIAMKLLSAIGGASGPLIASFFMAMAKAEKEHGTETPQKMAAAFAAGVEAIKQRGKSGIGEKTMLDVLIPVSQKFTEMAGLEANRDAVFQALKTEADKGMLATRDMVATKGRAAFLGERAKGHIDPGAKSAQIIINTICDLASGEK